MIQLTKNELTLFWDECDKIFDQFYREKMPSECYGWRSWKIEKALEKVLRGKLIWVDGKGFDFTDKKGIKYELKQVKDAFKSDKTPAITLKNFKRNTIFHYSQTFEHLLLIDVERRMLGVFDWDYVYEKHVVNSATITAILEHAYAKQIHTPHSLYHAPNYEIIENPIEVSRGEESCHLQTISVHS